MHLRFALALSTVSFLSAGCSWSSESGAITLRMVSDWEDSKESAEGSWEGEPISIINTHGEVRVVGVPGQTNIKMTARFVAGANSQEEAQPAFKDVAETMRIELQADGTWLVECDEASERHGEVVPSTTGCETLTVLIPAGTPDVPVSVSANADFGGVTAEKLTASRLWIRAPFGVLAQVDPVPGADIEVYNEDLVSGDCPAELYLPQDFATDSYNLSIQHGHLKRNGEPLRIDTSAFPDLTGPVGSRGVMGTGAKRIVVRASIGDVVLGTGPLPAIEGLSNCRDAKIELTP
jgi:hypothetical protein